jgi:hypothetical protein
MKRTYISIVLFLNAFSISAQDSIALFNVCGLDTFFTTMLVAESSQMSSENLKICQKLLYTNGQQNATLFLKNTSSPHVRFAACGITKEGIVSILINETTFRSYGFTNQMKFAFLAHELGHINHFHFLKQKYLDSLDELIADYYSGFCSAREGYSEDSSIYPFSILQSDASDIHPPFSSRRLSILNGYHHTENTDLALRLKNVKIDPDIYDDTTMSDLIGKYLSAAYLIQPLYDKKTTKSGKDWYKVTLSIQSSSFNLPNDTLMKFISKVEYLLHSSFPGNKFRSNSSLEIPPTWGDFDIPIIVTFLDESVASFTYKVRLRPAYNSMKIDEKTILSQFNQIKHN